MPQGTDAAGVRTLRLHSVFAEYFPSGHLPFLADVLTHPDMLALQRLCLGSDAVYFDHNQLLSRPGGYPGGHWHSHKIGAGCDSGTVLPDEYDRQANFLLTLCYLNGFEADNDGGLKIIRGSHLFRDPAGCNAATDEEMAPRLARGPHPSGHREAPRDGASRAAFRLCGLLPFARRPRGRPQGRRQTEPPLLALLLPQTVGGRPCPTPLGGAPGVGGQGTAAGSCPRCCRSCSAPATTAS